MGVDPPAPFHPLATRRIRSSGIDVSIVPIIILLPSTQSTTTQLTTPAAATSTAASNYTKKICIREVEDDNGTGERIISVPRETKLEQYETWENCVNRILNDDMKLLPFLHYSSNTETIIKSTTTSIEFLHAINDINTINQSHRIIVYMLVKIIDEPEILKVQEHEQQQEFHPNKIRWDWNFVDIIELQNQSYNLPDSFDPYLLHIIQDILPSKCL